MEQLALQLQHSTGTRKKPRTQEEQRAWAAEQWELFAATATPKFLAEICRATAAELRKA